MELLKEAVVEIAAVYCMRELGEVAPGKRVDECAIHEALAAIRKSFDRYRFLVLDLQDLASTEPSAPVSEFNDLIADLEAVCKQMREGVVHPDHTYRALYAILDKSKHKRGE